MASTFGVENPDYSFEGCTYVQSKASGRLLASNLELSFWGGIDPQTGEIIDRHHPLSGQNVQDTILAIPGGRGSCSGSGVMLELILNGKAPRAILFERREDILTLGVIIAEEMFGKAISVITLQPEDFQRLLKFNGLPVYVDGTRISSRELVNMKDDGLLKRDSSNVEFTVQLTDHDKEFLEGIHGEAARWAMRIIARISNVLGAEELIDVTQVHVDGCHYTGPGSLAFAERLRDMGARVRIPTSLNSISIDQMRWKAQSVDFDPEIAEPATKIADAYTDMGARPTFTCAPYQLESAPQIGEQVAWSESNAVVYANSVLGAKTMKYPDFLDIAIALTGRAPRVGAHIANNRLSGLIVRISGNKELETLDDSFYPLLGYHVGALASSQIPVVIGLESLRSSKDDMKAFGAAFATVSSAPMFHIVGVTPEATSLEKVLAKDSVVRTVNVHLKELKLWWETFNSAPGGQLVDLVSLGNPHFSLSEIRKLAELCRGRTKRGDVSIIVTCGRATYGLACQAKLIDELEIFGVRFINDTCWCMIKAPTISRVTKTIMTNSAKYAHYGPGLTGKAFYFGSLGGCVEAACDSRYEYPMPQWLLNA